jgi:NAD(P)-dependent dehydrogenase (short-subunit alcohol dehydrogenase family)
MAERTLESKVALVIGESTGIARAVALELSQAGAEVVVTGHEDRLRETAAQHSGITGVVAAVTRLPDAVTTLEELRCRHGRLDILVNNAGMAPVAPLPDGTPEQVRRVFHRNVLGFIEVTRHALPLLRRTRGLIVNVASVAADQLVANPVSSAVKATVLGLTRAWAREFAPQGIRVNVVIPDPDGTPTRGKMGPPEERIDDFRSGMISRIQPRRFGKLEEVAAIVSFLASPQSSFITGAQYVVGGSIAA